MSGRVKQETGRLEGTEREREDVKSELGEEVGGGGENTHYDMYLQLF